MSHMRKKSVMAFSISSFIVSLFISILVFSAELKIIIPIITSATVFAGSLGFIFGNYFSSDGKKSKYKAMLLGAIITSFTFIFCIAVSTIALKVNYYGYDALYQIDTYLSEIILVVGIGGAFTGPVLLPLGAYIGIYVKNA